ncbi:hypothetical protein [Mucilaginibacter ginkgonis]|uniref:Uncharacterized protein n=1 Tax=Mucilaginibacter ginkgonis TaxID=2682091 RepID=A0A6I4HYV6_9SPHI|nr:hypothetical protein [Mucilaginibacter ginkgonis]QQL50216.1 hypothetical protein GO620_001825 [Mucilaginibacter ginkgonis]
MLGFNSTSSITEIIKTVRTSTQKNFDLFKKHYSKYLAMQSTAPAALPQSQETTDKRIEGIPMYDIVATGVTCGSI